MTEESWFGSWQGKAIFLFLKVSGLFLGLIQPPVPHAMRAVSAGVKQLGSKTDQ